MSERHDCNRADRRPADQGREYSADGDPFEPVAPAAADCPYQDGWWPLVVRDGVPVDACNEWRPTGADEPDYPDCARCGRPRSEHAIDELLARAAERASQQPFYLGAVFQAFQAEWHASATDLLAWLADYRSVIESERAAATVLGRIALCRRPSTYPDCQEIANRFLLSADRLAKLCTIEVPDNADR